MRVALKLKKKRKKTEFVCSVCDKVFPWQSSLLGHMRAHTGERPFKCSQCDKTFGTPYNLKKHMQRHSGIRPFKCPVCEKQFVDKKDMQMHLKIHTGERPHKCLYCNKAFIHHIRMKEHMRIHTKELPCKCKVCGKAFRTQSNVTIHMLVHNPKRRFSCTVCSKAFSYQNVLDGHMRTHTGERPYKCSICNKAYKQYCALRDHKRTHTGERPHVCHICLRSFAYRTVLVKHYRTHTGEKPHSCPVCHQKFALLGNMKLHLARHTDEKPYVCHLCNTPYKKKAYLEKHLKVHAAKKNNEKQRIYLCHVCDDMFPERPKWQNHMLTQHKNLFPRCALCDQSFMDQDQFNVHTMQAHTNPDIQVKVEPHALVDCGENVLFTANDFQQITVKTAIAEEFASDELIRAEKVDEKQLTVRKRSASRKSDRALFECLVCDKKFRCKSLYSLHIRSCYGNLFEELNAIEAVTDQPMSPRKTFDSAIKEEIKVDTDIPDANETSSTNGTNNHANDFAIVDVQSLSSQPQPCADKNELSRLPYDQLHVAECGNTNGGLKQHEASDKTVFSRKHSGSRSQHDKAGSEGFSCLVCNKKFHSKAMHAVHVRSCVNIFHCSQCDKTYSTNGSLKNHMKTHSE